MVRHFALEDLPNSGRLREWTIGADPSRVDNYFGNERSGDRLSAA